MAYLFCWVSYAVPRARSQVLEWFQITMPSSWQKYSRRKPDFSVKNRRSAIRIAAQQNANAARPLGHFLQTSRKPTGEGAGFVR